MTPPLEALFAHLASAPIPRNRPLVTASYAQSLDGSIALHPGERLLLSGDAAMVVTHRLRACHDGILVGIGTVLTDDPRLTVRLAPGRQPQPVVLDTRLRLPTSAALLNHPRPPWVFAGPGANRIKMMALNDRGVDVAPLPVDGQGRLDLVALLAELRRRGTKRLMVEGGAAVLGSFLRARLIDIIAVTVSPLLAGGLHVLTEPVAPTATALPRLRDPHWVQVGDDALVWGTLVGAPEEEGAAAL